MGTSLDMISGWVLVAVGVLAVVQITLDVIALLDLYRRPAAQVVFGNKWIWAAIVLLVNLVGAILYLAAGRQPAATAENATPTASSSLTTENVADDLYGPRDEDDRR
jgi:NADH:ubiquinone oxidoreductase subunit 6 (subunit J)